MIKANELRIGNYVHVCYNAKGLVLPLTNIYSRIFTVDFDCAEVANDNTKAFSEQKCFKYSYGYIEPIPLTEEILLKCGFSITESILHENTNAYEIKSWGRIVLINGILQSDEFYFLDGLSTEIKYLHQLQNLYFALTNEELTIQL